MNTKHLVLVLPVFLFFFFQGGDAKATIQIFHSTTFARFQNESKPFTDIRKRSEIKLIAAGNETVSFQLVVKNIPTGIKSIGLRFEDFRRADLISPSSLKLFTLRNLQGSHLPDALVPVDSGVIDLDEIASEKDRLNIWCDLHVPFAQSTGFYQGNVTVFLDDISLNTLKISLRILPFVLPEIPSLKADLNNYGVKFVNGYGYQIGSSEGYRIERAVYNIARNHGITFNPLPYRSQLGIPNPTMAPELEGSGRNLRVKSWDAYDTRYGPLFDGSAFKNGAPLDHQYLPFNPEWPSDFSNYIKDRDLYETQWGLIAAEFIRHFKEKKWYHTIFQIYLNQKPRENNRIPWNLDEPAGRDDYKALRYYANLTHRVFNGAEPLKLKFRIDISHFYCDKHRWNFKKDFRINNGFNILSPVDVWVISRHSMDSVVAQKKALKLKSMGKTVYEYFAGPRMPLIEDSLLEGIRCGWRAWSRKEDGILFWNTVKRQGKDSDGRDFLIYPGYMPKTESPIPSIRLKAIRRGIQDYEYFKLASKYKDIDQLLEKYMTNNPEDYQKCREELAEIIISATDNVGHE